MIPKSVAIIQITILLLLNNGFFSLQSVATEISSTSPSPSPSPSPLPFEEYGPSPPFEDQKLSPQFKKFLKQCQKRMTVECADQIVGYMFDNKTVSKTCCSKLVNMGPDCHKGLVMRGKELTKQNAYVKKILSKSEELWKKCEKIAPRPKDKNYPKLPPREYLPGYAEFLRECAKKLTEKCGNEVSDSIFKNHKTVDKGCCWRVLHMGRDCHEEMLKDLISLGDMKNKTPREVKLKSDQIWKRCERIARHN
ncbi:uncharacterized protein LOC105167735 [Sesamum indicum]|uniref:Uncharacterized protein LOC105167735 n=1 Tax=Sesamum indicum TaxID=4182 RepID=A0A6I9TMZ0_SESIN|nr:uncharacterized protein LOC105167735 [Sesamum indicum]